MKKVLFFMFLLFLCLGTASVKAQVRIGGNTAPNASAVLDLNANDTNNGTKGLALPRVGLTSNTMLLPGVTANLTGMLVYNTSTTGGAGVNAIGIYFWNGATWVKASLPSTSAADSAAFLRFTNGTAQWTLPYGGILRGDTIATARPSRTVTWSIVVDTLISIDFPKYSSGSLSISGIQMFDICVSDLPKNFIIDMYARDNNLIIRNFYSYGTDAIPPGTQFRIRCYHPAF